jgi:hypothetical protein
MNRCLTAKDPAPWANISYFVTLNFIDETRRMNKEEKIMIICSVYIVIIKHWYDNVAVYPSEKRNQIKSLTERERKGWLSRLGRKDVIRRARSMSG